MNVMIDAALRLRSVVGALVLIASCGDPEPTPPPVFAPGFSALDRAFSADVLNRTGFPARYPKPTAQQLVSFLFSPAGAQAMLSDVTPLGEDLDPTADVPVWPHGMILRHTDRTEVGVRQVVLTWDNERGVVIGEAFDGGTVPVFRKEWPVPSLVPERSLDPTDRSSYQAF